MHANQHSRYAPTSPLSPRPPQDTSQRPPLSSRHNPQSARRATRDLQMSLPRFHPANFSHADGLIPNMDGQSPPPGLPRAPPATVIETPRLMRERQRDLLDRARMASKMAASPMAVKPDAPRLPPLGSPKGPVTPLALEEGPGDYFTAAKQAGRSPAASPGAKSEASVSDISDSATKKKTKKKKKKKRKAGADHLPR